MPNYKVGDTVICIDATDKMTLRRGQTYIVSWMGKGCCGISTRIHVKGEPEYTWFCHKCGKDSIPYEKDGHGAWRFIKLDETRVEDTVEKEYEAVY